MESKEFVEIAPGVWSMKIVFVNIYMVTTGIDEWVLVDAGLKGSAAKIFKMAEELYGDNPPSAIILTHGHFDHTGALKQLLRKWDVKVYAHPLEMPYLTGMSSYPPADPSAGGGAMTCMSFLYPEGPIDLGSDVVALDEEQLPGMPGWKYIHTPGHSPGHISLFRPKDRVLIVGDAFVNTEAESLFSVVAQRKKLSGPPRYFTPNWLAAAISVKKLRDLKPEVAGSGHGPVIKGDDLTQGLGNLADNFQKLAIPSRGRYVKEPAKANEKGVQYLPPESSSKTLIVALFALSAITVFSLVNKSIRK